MNDMSHETCQAEDGWSRGKSLRGKDSRNSPCDPWQHPRPIVRASAFSSVKWVHNTYPCFVQESVALEGL